MYYRPGTADTKHNWIRL